MRITALSSSLLMHWGPTTTKRWIICSHGRKIHTVPTGIYIEESFYEKQHKLIKVWICDEFSCSVWMNLQLQDEWTARVCWWDLYFKRPVSFYSCCSASFSAITGFTLNFESESVRYYLLIILHSSTRVWKRYELYLISL